MVGSADNFSPFDDSPYYEDDEYAVQALIPALSCLLCIPHIEPTKLSRCDEQLWNPNGVPLDEDYVLEFPSNLVQFTPHDFPCFNH